jgi:hypothetical protein
MNASLCHSGVVLMKTEYTNQQHNSSTRIQPNTTSTMATAVKQTRDFTIHYSYTYGLRAGIAQGLATGWTVRGSIHGGGEIFRTRPDRPWGPLGLVCDEHRISFMRVERPGIALNTHAHLGSRLKKE